MKPTLPRTVAGALALVVINLPAAEFYVAPAGADTNPGTEAKPFATLERARDAIRELKKAGPLQTPVTVRIRGGDYFLSQPLQFEPQDSGTAQAPITYEAAAGEEPVLSGGVLLTGWREVLPRETTVRGTPTAVWERVARDQPRRWETTLPEVAAGRWHFSQLYVNDQRRFRPILPKEGYYEIAGLGPKSAIQQSKPRSHE